MMNKPFLSLTSDKPVLSHICAYMVDDKVRVSVDGTWEDIMQQYRCLVERLKMELDKELGVGKGRGLLTFATLYALGDAKEREKLLAQAQAQVQALGIEVDDD